MYRIITYCILFAFIFSCKNRDTPIEKERQNDVIEVLNLSELEPLLKNADAEKTYVINFWATWCAPCIKELPYFQELHESQEDIEVILVSLDFPDKLESQLIPFIEKNKITPQVILLDDPDENTWIPAVDSTWSGALPATIIYNKNKRSFYEQSFTKEGLMSEVEKFTKI